MASSAYQRGGWTKWPTRARKRGLEDSGPHGAGARSALIDSASYEL